MTMTALKILRDDFVLWIEADNKSLTELATLLHPFFLTEFKPCPRERPDGEWHLSSGNSIFAQSFRQNDFIEDSLTPEGEPYRSYRYLPGQKNIEIVQPQDPVWKSQHIMRLVRVIARWHLAAKPVHFLHGGMVIVDGQGLVFLGKKRAGKTTTVLNVLGLENTSLVSNDDVCLQMTKGKVTGLGFPRSISIRRDTLAFLDKSLQSWLDSPALKHPGNQTPQQETHRFAFPHEVATQMNRELSPHGSVNALIFPQFDDHSRIRNESELRSLDATEALELLHSNVEIKINKYSECFERSYPLPLPLPPQHTDELQHIAQKIPAFRLIQSLESLESSKQLLAKLVTRL